jgi:hypothetical protein
MVWDHIQTERGMRVSYWSGFPAGGTSIQIAVTLEYE